MVKMNHRMETGRVVYLPVGAIQPNPSQPRKVFDPVCLQELASSIVQYGILQPLTVRRSGRGYELVAGERRLRAARIAGLTEVPCIVMALDEEESGMLALVENLQRRDLDFIEEAAGLARLMRLYGLSQEQAAMRVGKSQSAVANKLRLLRHSEQVLDALRQNHLSERHARALLKLNGEQEKLDVISVIAVENLNVTQTEQYIERLLSQKEKLPRADKPQEERDVRVFLNTLNRNLERIRSAGFPADCGRDENENEIVLTIRIQKQAG